MELDSECPDSNWIFPSWISVGRIYPGLGYMWIWSKKKHGFLDILHANPNIHGSPSIKHHVLAILEARVTPPSFPGRRRAPGRCSGKSACYGWVAAPTSWGCRRGKRVAGCVDMVRLMLGWKMLSCQGQEGTVLVPALAVPCSAQHGGEVGQCRVHLGLLPSQGVIQRPWQRGGTKQNRWGLSVLGFIWCHGGCVGWSAGVSVMPVAAAGKACVRFHSDELEPQPSPLNRCNLNPQLRPATRSNWNHPEASSSMVNLRSLR